MTLGPSDPILPSISAVTTDYWRGTRERRLTLPRCKDCRRAFLPAQTRCPGCLGLHVGWEPASGTATLYSWVVVHQIYDPSFAGQVPYVVAIVELSEGPRLVSNLVNCSRQSLRAGLSLRAVFRDITDEITLVDFEPEMESA